MERADKLDEFRAYLAAQGLKFTRQREAIVEAFYDAGGEHLSLIDLLERAKARHSTVGYATVYRTMRLMAESGLAAEHKFNDGHTTYEPREAGEHHDHLICLKCGRIVEFEDDEIERLQADVARRNGFRVRSHRHEIYGECAPSCPPQP